MSSTEQLTGGRYFLVKLDSDERGGVRSLKISSVKQRMRSMFGSDRQFMEPDRDWQVPFSASEVGPDLWSVTPERALEPGEYGWYVDIGQGVQQAGLFAFGIDP